MAYDLQRLADVELLDEVPDGASAFIEIDGDVRRVPGSGLGGGVKTAILRFSDDNNTEERAATEGQAAEGGVATQSAIASPTKYPVTCDNMTYAQARAVLEAEQPLAVMMCAAAGVWFTALAVYLNDASVKVVFGDDGLFWDADGFWDGEPSSSSSDSK